MRGKKLSNVVGSLIRVNVSGHNSLWSPSLSGQLRCRTVVLFNLFDVCVVLSNVQLFKNNILDAGSLEKNSDVHPHVNSSQLK